MITADDIGRRVQGGAGRVGILRDVIADYEDPAELPGERRKRAMAFLGAERGGREWAVPPDAVAPAAAGPRGGRPVGPSPAR
ncbi:hypothetical protein [Streptomyces sp. NPDC056169]|uniref:hypothetical protein n=1 Tax=Streptomyces sp. NPDC056169 TaxID=3345734 RepID=UPI0035D883BF